MQCLRDVRVILNYLSLNQYPEDLISSEIVYQAKYFLLIEKQW